MVTRAAARVATAGSESTPAPAGRDAACVFGYPSRMSETEPETPGRHAAPDDDPTSDPPPAAGEGGEHRADGPAEED